MKIQLPKQRRNSTSFPFIAVFLLFSCLSLTGCSKGSSSGTPSPSSSSGTVSARTKGGTPGGAATATPSSGAESAKAKSGTSASAPAATSSYSSVYSFKGNPGDGKNPEAALAYDSTNGMFYGTTYAGETEFGSGTIFKYDPSTNTETVVYSFKGGLAAPGGESGPAAALTYDPADGMFYGTTYYVGTIFKYNPSTNAETQVHSFGGTASRVALTYDPANKMFYGTIAQGGTQGMGRIFEFNPQTDAETVVYSFQGEPKKDGGFPRAALTYDPANGMFYGTTKRYGAAFNGTLFKFNPQTNVETVVHSFQTSGREGSAPLAALTYDAANGMFYGTASGGGTAFDGTVFKFNPQTNALTVVYSFGSVSGDGKYPKAAWIYDSGKGVYYGTTSGGGTSNAGTIFEFNPQTNAETVVYSFKGMPSEPADGKQPWGALTYDPANKTYFGTTRGGGTNYDGTIFKFKP